MKKDFKYIELFDLYSGLLTEKQREVFTSYYLYDLSLAEIAEPEGTTRQSVHEMIKSTVEKLNFFEQALKIHERNVQLLELAKDADNEELSKKITRIIGK